MAYTESQLRTQIANAIYIAEATRQYGNALSPNMISLTDSVYAALQESRSPAVAAGVGAFRAALSSTLEPEFVRSMVDPLVIELARVKNYAQTSPPAIMRRLLYDYANEGTPVTIEDRNTTFGAVAAGGSNVGTGTVYRLTKDPYDYPIQAVHPEIKTFTCIRSQYQGANAGQENFRVEGVEQEPDLLKVIGSGISTDLAARNGADTNRYIQNPSWSGSETGTTFTGWTFSTGSPAHDTTNYYRTYNGEGTAGSLKISTNCNFYQNLTTRRSTFYNDVPYFISFAWNRSVGSAPAATTIDLDLGGQSSLISVTLGGAESGWQIAVPTMDKKLYFQNWTSAAAQVKITVGSLSSGYLLFDDLQLHPMTRIDGIWYTILGGATDFKSGDRDAGDTFTFNDATQTGAVLAYWFWQMYGVDGQLPVTTGTPVWSEPVAWA